MNECCWQRKAVSQDGLFLGQVLVSPGETKVSKRPLVVLFFQHIQLPEVTSRAQIRYHA